ncbi:MAG: cytidylyltransferase [Bacteriovoracaceae bacterium]|nr:cytidylyltransferase [Bacteriovoracaceae bacterium]
MICSLILGRKGSVGFPGKNLYDIDGHPLAWYPMQAALNTVEIDKNFISTDDPELINLGKKVGFELINRPDYLATSEALGDDAYKHGYQIITDRIGERPELLILMFCNAPTITSKQISQGIQMLRDDPSADSAVTVSRYNMYSPTRARRVSSDGTLKPYIDFEHHPELENINCDRDSQGDVWFADVAVSIIRPENLDNLEYGLLPQRWMGRKILPIYNEAGLDMDYEWQIGQVKWWLDNKK